MRLVVATDESSVIALDDLRPYLEHGSLNVRLDAVTEILAAIRSAAEALTPKGSPLLEVDPVRQEQVAVAGIILSVASAAGRLAAAAPKDDPDAQQVKRALTMLHLT